MVMICYYLSAAMLGAGLGTSNAFGHLFNASAAVLLAAAMGFYHLSGD